MKKTVKHNGAKAIARNSNKSNKGGQDLMERGYREVAGVGEQFSDWAFSLQGEDSDLWQNVWALTSRMRDLFRTNPIFTKIRETLWSNVFGEHGIMCRMKIKETEDRIVYAPDEAKHLRMWEDRVQRVMDWAGRITGNPAAQYRAFKLADTYQRMSPDEIIRGKATIQIGQPDIFANELILNKWKEWQLPLYCDLRQARPYQILRQLRLISAIRDGDFFIRMIASPGVNKFGFTTQIINAEWCDHFYNTQLPNGNVVIMGIEHKMTPWGLGPKIAYYFIKRQPQDWQFSIPGAFNFTGGELHIRIDAREIIHYARPVDADSTRPAPWLVSTIPLARQGNEYAIAEVIAARENACKMGVLWSDVDPEGGQGSTTPDPQSGAAKLRRSPGALLALKYGVKYSEINPTHPNQNYPAFMKQMQRLLVAGVPSGDYNSIANDMESVNFASGKLGRLDSNEVSKTLQRWDIDCAERVIFENWLDMALITGAVPLPLAKFDKFNKPVFMGRRWKSADEVKDNSAAAMRIANNMSSWSRECADQSIEFNEEMFQKAEDLMTMSELGIDPTLTVQPPKAAPPQVEDDDENQPGENGDKPTDKPEKKPVAEKNGNGKHLALPASRM